MGSFRIVTGSGYGRKEISAPSAIANEFRKMKRRTDVYKSTSKSIRRAQPRASTPTRTSSRSSGMFAPIIDNAISVAMKDMERKAHKWALETVSEFQSIAPYDTGNLAGSFGILNVSKGKYHLSVTVGVDEDEILPPPDEMWSTKRRRMVDMPNYDYSPFVLGRMGAAHSVASSVGRGRVSPKLNSITTTFSKVALRNAQKIIKK